MHVSYPQKRRTWYDCSVTRETKIGTYHGKDVEAHEVDPSVVIHYVSIALHYYKPVVHDHQLKQRHYKHNTSGKLYRESTTPDAKSTINVTTNTMQVVNCIERAQLQMLNQQ